MIAVVDYRAGNLASVMKALRAVGAICESTSDPDAVRQAQKIILPGVGHFAATRFLEEQGLRVAIEERIGAGAPFLGICVGLQWLYAGSSEAPGVPGLGVFSELCDRFVPGKKIPHVGWNSLAIRSGSLLMSGIGQGSFLYFTHSWRAPVTNDTVAVTEYGEPFTAAVERRNVMGVQFHPEKSGAAGLRVLENFVRLAC